MIKLIASLFAASFIVVSCSVKTKNDLTKKGNAQQIEDFKSFFKRFGSDSLYQKESIKFPLKFEYYEDYGDDLTITEIAQADWDFINFLDDTLAASYTEDAYTISFIKQSNSEVEYLRSGIDNGISVAYYFKRNKSKWYLERIVDRSN